MNEFDDCSNDDFMVVVLHLALKWMWIFTQPSPAQPLYSSMLSCRYRVAESKAQASPPGI